MVILPIHVGIAVASVLYSTVLYMSPSRAKFKFTYGLVGLTLASGTYLVVASHAAMLSSCTTGLIYIGVMFVAIYASHRKLASQKTRHINDQ